MQYNEYIQACEACFKKADDHTVSDYQQRLRSLKSQICRQISILLEEMQLAFPEQASIISSVMNANRNEKKLLETVTKVFEAIAATDRDCTIQAREIAAAFKRIGCPKKGTSL